MKKSPIFTTLIFVTMSTLFATVATAQLRVIVFKQGNFSTASENPAVGDRCNCGQAQFDCLCGINNFATYSTPNEIQLPKGQIHAEILSQVLTENKLEIKFKKKLPMKLKSNDFTQKQEILLDSFSAHSLGYDSVIILPGKYSIKNRCTLELDVRFGERGQCSCFGIISYVDNDGPNYPINPCLNFGTLPPNLSGFLCDTPDHYKTCCKRLEAVVNNLSAGQIQSIADCYCAQGASDQTPVQSYHAVGNHAYRYCKVIGILTNTPPVFKTTCKCPTGWLANQTNVDGGITADGKCKKAVCGPFNILQLPPDGTPVGTWGFTWGNGLYAWGTTANGGAAACTTVQVSPAVCKIQ